MAMTRNLMYKFMISNMGDQILPKITLQSSEDNLQLKRVWHKDTMTWLNHWWIDENVTLQNINNIKNIITSKYKQKMWDKNDLVFKRK